MKKLILVLGILLLSLSASSVAYAGSLNSYENEVISAAKGVFEADGIKYVLASSYLDQLIGYLSSDDVDITEEQKNEVLAVMYDYVATGVEEGYLIPVDGQISVDETDSVAKNDSVIDSSKDNGKTEPLNTDSNSGAKQTVEESTAAESESDKNSDNNKAQNETVVKVSEDNDTNTLVQEISEQISGSTGQAIPEAEKTIIKNTGFNLNRTVVVAVGMGLLMIICMIVTCKFKFFAQSDE